MPSRLLAVGLVALLSTPGAFADVPDLLEDEIERVALAHRRPDEYGPQIDAAETLLRAADRLRNERKIRSSISSNRDDAYREAQALWADRALPFAEHALEIASDDTERGRAERVIGELYAHRIKGMISGMINGPRARRHLGRALELAPDDPESQRAIGLMYLNNPPISGGDVPKAIEIFERCSEEIPDERCLVLLALSYRKSGADEEARVAAEAALARRRESQEARWLLEELGAP